MPTDETLDAISFLTTTDVTSCLLLERSCEVVKRRRIRHRSCGGLDSSGVDKEQKRAVTFPSNIDTQELESLLESISSFTLGESGVGHLRESSSLVYLRADRVEKRCSSLSDLKAERRKVTLSPHSSGTLVFSERSHTNITDSHKAKFVSRDKINSDRERFESREKSYLSREPFVRKEREDQVKTSKRRSKSTGRFGRK